MREKQCRECGNTFMPSGPAGLYCELCRAIVKRRKNTERMRNFRMKMAEMEGTLDRFGIGRGGGQRTGINSASYKNGIRLFRKESIRMKSDIRYCMRCGKDLIDADRYMWCVHHIDHDRSNNSPDNFELLCKRCHQIEHECWEAFEGSTTIPKGSRLK